MQHIRHNLAVCVFGCVLLMGCSRSQPKDADTVCALPAAHPDGHGHVLATVGDGLGHLAPMALSAIPGMNGIGGQAAGMGMQQVTNRFGMDHPRGMVSSVPLHAENANSDQHTIPSVPCPVRKTVQQEVNGQDIKFSE